MICRKVVSTCEQECRQLDGEERLQTVAGARSGLEASAHALSQSVATIGVRLQADLEEAQAVRGAVMHLLRNTEAAVHAFERARAWREAGRAAPGQPVPSHVANLGGPVALPSPFLVETIDALHDRLRSHQAAAAELEAVLQQRARGAATAAGGDPTAVLASLHASVANLHDCLMRTAAQMQALDDKVQRAKAARVAALRHAGATADPFDEAERQEANAERRQQEADKSRARSTPPGGSGGQQHGE